MNPVRVFFPRFSIESHREPWQSAAIVTAFARHDVHCLLEMDASVDLVFVGGISPTEDAANGYRKDPFGRWVPGYREFPNVPVVHYCWDLYPWVVEDANHPDRARWLHYLAQLKNAREVWVPSSPVKRRVEQYVGRDDAKVTTFPVPFWDPPEGIIVRDGGYVLDVMRPYPGDEGTGLVASVCAELGIPCRETHASLGYRDYQDAIAGAGLLVSAYREASTGSLALLEGYQLGKGVLISDSEWHGGLDIFGSRAWYFESIRGRESLRDEIQRILAVPYDLRQIHPSPSKFRWCELRYSDDAFAEMAAREFRRILNRIKE